MEIDKRDEKAILEAVLAGHKTPAEVAEYVYESSDAGIINAVGRLMRTIDFRSALIRAREDLLGTALESFKRTVMENVREMKALALEAQDPRVRYQANKDILDRVGLAPAAKTDLRYTIADYEKILDGFKKEDDETPETEAGSPGVVPSSGSHPEEGSSGS